MKTRVLHIIDSLDLGGAQVVVENLIRHGDRERFEFEVATLQGRGVFWERIARLGVPVHSLSPRKWLPLYVPRLLWLLARRHFDVVHCHLVWSNIIAKPLAALCGVRTRISHDHCNDKSEMSAPVRLLDRWMNRLSTKVIAVSESTRAGLLADGRLAEGRVVTIYNGIDTGAHRARPERRAEARERFGIPADAFAVGGIGRLTFQKNFPLFVEVAAEVCRTDARAHFIIAGTGPDEAELRAQIGRLGLADRVRLAGFVGDMAALYPALDCLLLTSRYEGLPITMLEAMACGVPIVAGNLDGMREILRDGETAMLVSPGEAGPYVERVRHLISESDAGVRLAKAARSLAEAKLSAGSAARAVERLYTPAREP